MKVLFVCKGNVVRSFSAEYFSKKFIQKNKLLNIQTSSGGTEAGNYNINQELALYKKLKIDYSNHKQRKISEDIIKDNDLIIAMDKFNQKYIKNNFDVNSILFNDFCYNNKKGIINFQSITKEEEIILYIKKSIPFFFKNLKSYIKSNPEVRHS